MPSSDMYCEANDIECTLRTGTFLWDTSGKMNFGESEMKDSIETPSPNMAAAYLYRSDLLTEYRSPPS